MYRKCTQEYKLQEFENVDLAATPSDGFPREEKKKREKIKLP